MTQHLLIWLVLPAAALALVSGLALALLTPWGLLRHRWIVAKLAINVATLVTTVTLLIPWASAATRQVPGSTELPSVLIARLGFIPLLHASVLVVATALSVVKPWGLTRRAARQVRQRHAASI